jgi:hypothetical protein
MADLQKRFITYLATLHAAAPTKDLTTLVVKDKPTIIAAAPTAVDLNAAYLIALP